MLPLQLFTIVKKYLQTADTSLQINDIYHIG